MNSEPKPRSTSKIVGWVLSGLLTAFMMFSASGKFMDFPGKAEMFGKLGWSEGLMFNIGIVEVIIALLFLVPRAAFVAAILLTAYLGGAVAAHVRIGDAFVFQVTIAVVYWIALGLRDRRVFDLAWR